MKLFRNMRASKELMNENKKNITNLAEKIAAFKKFAASVEKLEKVEQQADKKSKISNNMSKDGQTLLNIRHEIRAKRSTANEFVNIDFELGILYSKSNAADRRKLDALTVEQAAGQGIVYSLVKITEGIRKILEDEARQVVGKIGQKIKTVENAVNFLNIAFAATTVSLIAVCVAFFSGRAPHFNNIRESIMTATMGSAILGLIAEGIHLGSAKGVRESFIANFKAVKSFLPLEESKFSSHEIKK